MASHLLKNRLGLVAAAVALVGASCGATEAPVATESDGPVEITDTATLPTEPIPTEPIPTEPIRNSASFRGVTADTISVGVMAVEWETLAAVGVDFGRSNSADLWEAALTAINDRGGVHGRQLVVHSEYYLPVGSASFDESCVRLTEDKEIFVVVGLQLESMALCFTELHNTASIAVAGLADPLIERSTAPFATLWASSATQSANTVSLAEQAGLLDDVTIGVSGATALGDLDFYSLVDAFAEAGHEVIEGLIGDTGNDIEATGRAQDVVFERMRDAGVDLTVATTGVPLEIFNAQSAGYSTDRWLLTVMLEPNALVEAGIDLQYLDGAYAIVNTAVGTTAQPAMADDPGVAQCLADLAAGSGRTVTTELGLAVNDITVALYACGIADLLEAALDAAGPELTNDSLQLGLESIGEIDLPGYFDARLEPGNLGAARGLLLARFDADAAVWELVD
ncbi:MAG: hypothetical protein ACI9C1_002309 [Candidatus Aldehydirespiratoraceae bacterium]